MSPPKGESGAFHAPRSRSRRWRQRDAEVAAVDEPSRGQPEAPLQKLLGVQKNHWKRGSVAWRGGGQGGGLICFLQKGSRLLLLSNCSSWLSFFWTAKKSGFCGRVLPHVAEGTAEVALGPPPWASHRSGGPARPLGRAEASRVAGHGVGASPAAPPASTCLEAVDQKWPFESCQDPVSSSERSLSRALLRTSEPQTKRGTGFLKANARLDQTRNP